MPPLSRGPLEVVHRWNGLDACTVQRPGRDPRVTARLPAEALSGRSGGADLRRCSRLSGEAEEGLAWYADLPWPYVREYVPNGPAVQSLFV